MTLRLGFAALLVTALYALFTSLWWYPTGQEGPPAEVRMTGIRDQVHGDLPSRGLPVVALER